MELNKMYVYDLECYPNVFTAYIGNASTRKSRGFEISDRVDERQEMIAFLRKIKREDAWMVGFNNIGFDYPLLHFILKNQDCAVKEIYDKGMEIIFAPEEDKFKNLIRADKMMLKQLDLYKIHHFDNVARATSLKMIEFNMRSDDIEDLPYAPGSVLTNEQIDNLKVYNKHDMYQTYLFLMESLDQIEFREKLSEQYGKDFMNHNDGKIGKEYFIMKLEEESPGICYKVNKYGRKINQTIRKSINLEECILPYVEFERSEFQAVLDWIKKQTITETKGVFSDILEGDLGELAKYCEMTKKSKKLPEKPTEEEMRQFKKDNPKCWVEERELKSKKIVHYLCWNISTNLNCVVDGFRYDFGTGGIHGAVENRVLESTDEVVVKSYDVASYYPNLAIKHRVYPEHLSETFCDIYEDVYEQRKSYAKGTPENAMMKLALNSVYGDSNSRFSPFYDSKYTMTITINGQLSLCMLAEQLVKIEGLEIVMINTDGLEFVVGIENEERAHKVCTEWEELTKLTLEGDAYKKLCIRDVNSYIGIT